MHKIVCLKLKLSFLKHRPISNIHVHRIISFQFQMNDNYSMNSFEISIAFIKKISTRSKSPVDVAELCLPRKIFINLKCKTVTKRMVKSVICKAVSKGN